MADSSIVENKIANGAVTTTKIADNAVTTAKILNANVTSAKLANGAVGTAAIADGAVTTAKLALGAIDVSNVNGAAPLASPIFTGSPQAPTAASGTTNNVLATTAFVQNAASTTAVNVATTTATSVASSVVSNSINTIVGRQRIGTITSNGSQSTLTINANAPLTGVKRWGFDWSLQGTYNNNNQSFIFFRINGESASNSYRSIGLYVASTAVPLPNVISFDWGNLYNGNLIVLAVSGETGTNLGGGTGGTVEFNYQYWKSTSVMHISQVRLSDLIYQSGYWPGGSAGLSYIQFSSYSRDLNVFTNFPSGFTATVWCEQTI
jgi:hypothetical protein